MKHVTAFDMQIKKRIIRKATKIWKIFYKSERNISSSSAKRDLDCF